MIWKEYRFKWEKINKKDLEFQIWLTAVNFKKLDVTDETINITWNHGVRTSPTFARTRQVSIEWIILAESKLWLSKAMDFLEKLFVLQYDFRDLELHNFSLVDDADRLWHLKTKIKQPIEYDLFDDDYLEWASRKFRVVLIAPDPRFLSDDMKVINTWAIKYGGCKLWVKLWVKLNLYYNSIECFNNWNFASPFRMVIKIKQNLPNKLVIQNLDTKEYITLLDNFVAWDIIEINTEKYTITRNWQNIKHRKTPWSRWLQIIWLTRFWVFNEDLSLDTNFVDVTVYFSNVML